MCHLILFMPVLALPIFWVMPLNVAISIYVLIVLTSGLLYWIIVKSMREKPKTGREGLIGASAEVISRSNPGKQSEYMVRFQGELWSATSPDTLSAGDAVNVAAVDHLRLTVRKNGESDTEIADERHCH